MACTNARFPLYLLSLEQHKGYTLSFASLFNNLNVKKTKCSKGHYNQQLLGQRSFEHRFCGRIVEYFTSIKLGFYISVAAETAAKYQAKGLAKAAQSPIQEQSRRTPVRSVNHEE